MPSAPYYEVIGGEITGTPLISCAASNRPDVGTYTITVERGTVQGNVIFQNGSLTINKKNLTAKAVDVTIPEGTPILDMFTINYSGFVNGDTENTVFTGEYHAPIATTTATTSSTPGVYEITVSGGSAKNYNIVPINGRLTITGDIEPDDPDEPDVPIPSSVVDLGLPSGTLWADRNVGAVTTGETGSYYSWGETEPKSNYSKENYSMYDSGSGNYTYPQGWSGPHGTNGLSQTEYDVAYKNTNGELCTPLPQNYTELCENCEFYTGYTLNNIYGVFAISKNNGKYIFFPSTGYYQSQGRTGYNMVVCRTSSLWLFDTHNPARDALWFDVNVDKIGLSRPPREYGATVRGIKQGDVDVLEMEYPNPGAPVAYEDLSNYAHKQPDNYSIVTIDLITDDHNYISSVVNTTQTVPLSGGTLLFRHIAIKRNNGVYYPLDGGNIMSDSSCIYLQTNDGGTVHEPSMTLFDDDTTYNEYGGVKLYLYKDNTLDGTKYTGATLKLEIPSVSEPRQLKLRIGAWLPLTINDGIFKVPAIDEGEADTMTIVINQAG